MYLLRRPQKQLSIIPLCFKRHNTIGALQAAFRDPSSPFYIPPGTNGPPSADDEHAASGDPMDSLEEARRKLVEAGFDPGSFWEQRIVWGDQDSFQHVNNTRYIRFFESSRVTWFRSLRKELGESSGGAQPAMIKPPSESFILKTIEVQFRRPVTYPDTLLVGYRPKLPGGKRDDRSTFSATASAYSLRQRTFVAHSNEVWVWYDYNRLEKCVPSEDVRQAVLGRAQDR